MMQAILIGNDTLTRHCAEAWRARGHAIAAVVTRHGDVAAWAQGRGAARRGPRRGAGARLGDLACDWLLSIANLDLLPQDVLARATRGAVNFHDGPLPRHAGLNAPVWAILEGEAQHGITWHLIEGGTDEGRIIAQRTLDIAGDETALSLNAKCFATALDSFPAVIGALERGLPDLREQNLAQRSYHARDDRPEAAWLDFTRPAADLARVVRALDHGGYPNPLCMARLRAGGRILLTGKAEPVPGAGAPGTVLESDATALTVATGAGALRLEALTGPEGGAVDLPAIAPVGCVLTQPTEADRQALRHLARDEGYWRARLSEMRPVTLPLWARGRGRQRDRAPRARSAYRYRARGHRRLGRAARRRATHIAYAGPAQDNTPAPDMACPWVPADVMRLEAEIDAADTRAPFSRDLFARDPALDPRTARIWACAGRDRA